ncbi:MAG TPA: hypothetical protein VHB25_21365 [Gemmatimonadaceae bacterium]|nr:hypothetical protein [Gemmatimonadaceae bacterium]
MTQLVQDRPVVLGQPTTDSRWYGAASRHVVQFLHDLRCLPASMWLAAADQCDPIDGHAHPADVAATEHDADGPERRLHVVLNSMPVVARRIRQRVNSELAVFDGMIPEPAIQRMRRVAHLAACALAAGPLLAREDLERLYQPFADVIPRSNELVTE